MGLHRSEWTEMISLPYTPLQNGLEREQLLPPALLTLKCLHTGLERIAVVMILADIGRRTSMQNGQEEILWKD